MFLIRKLIILKIFIEDNYLSRELPRNLKAPINSKDKVGKALAKPTTFVIKSILIFCHCHPNGELAKKSKDMNFPIGETRYVSRVTTSTMVFFYFLTW